MIRDQKIVMGYSAEGEAAVIEPKMANRHGLIAGATGTGKTVSLKVMAEGFSTLGVPVFVSDVKGDISGMAAMGTENENVTSRLEAMGIGDFSYEAYPVTFWDIYGKNGIPLRTTISEMGPLLLSKILNLTTVQSDVLGVVFKIADDEQLLLTDTKDLKAMLAYVSEKNKEYEAEYGKMSSQSLAAITRAVVVLESEGGDKFFGEPALSVADWFTTDTSGRGMMHILDASSLINSPKLYGAFLLWLLSELFELLPEVGDLELPRMIFFFDEAHLLFNDASKALLEKIEQVVKLIRSKGVGIYFCTQNPADIPGGVLSQLSNKIEHALHAYSPAEQKGVKVIAASYPVNPDFDTFDAIQSLGTGEAVISFLREDGIPSIATKVSIVPPQSSMTMIDAAQREQKIKGAMLYAKYYNPTDPDTAYEFLQRRAAEREMALTDEKRALEEAKALEKEEKAAQKAAEKEAQRQSRAKKQAVKTVGNTVAGTVGREIGKQVGKNMGGTFGKTLGGNVGASIGRGLLATLLNR